MQLKVRKLLQYIAIAQIAAGHGRFFRIGKSFMPYFKYVNVASLY
jgi:hypothetical protein